MTQETEALELTQHEQSILDPRCWAFVTDLKRKAYAAGVAETEAKDRHYVWAEELAAERAKAAGLVIALKDVLSLNVVDGFRQRRYRAAIAAYEGE